MATAAPPVDAAGVAAELHAARHDRRPVDPLTSRWPDMGYADAYAIQARGVELRLADGERLVGGKLGFTSEAMRQAMGVDRPNYGWLTDGMWIYDGVVDLSRFIHPKVEPEIAFLLGRDLVAPVTANDVYVATEAVMASLEIVDSRYEGFRFGPLDNIADNSSAGAVVLGDPAEPSGIDLRLAGVVLSVDGQVTGTAAGAAAHDDPAAAVAWMVNNCGQPLRAGAVVISGGLTAPVTLRAGRTTTVEVDRIGSVTVRAR